MLDQIVSARIIDMFEDYAIVELTYQSGTRIEAEFSDDELELLMREVDVA